MKNVVCIGECMIELVQLEAEDQYVMSFAGDTYNTAVYLKRLLGAEAEVFYLTALGDDHLSKKMITRLEAEGIKSDLVIQKPGKGPGLYLIENDEKGERYFQYWRSDSAARYMFKNMPERDLQQVLSKFDLIYLSGISLAILDTDQRELIFSVLAGLKSDRMIAFDPNFRPVLWPDLSVARQVFKRMGGIATIVLTGSEDEARIWDQSDASLIFERWNQWGCKEVVLKEGPKGCKIYCRNRLLQVPVSLMKTALDTTGAGDSFCAGYLSSRLQGNSMEQSAETGHRTAGKVILYKGAIVPINIWNELS